MKAIIEVTGYEFDGEELNGLYKGQRMGFQIIPNVGVDVEKV